MNVPERNLPWHRWRLCFTGLLLLGGLVLVVTHVGELGRFIELARNARPQWLLAALVLQFCTYLSAAAAWHLPLRAGGSSIPICTLLPLSVAKLFSDQVLPSAGVSGTAFQLAALTRRGVMAELVVGVMLVTLVCYYGACLLMDAVAVLILWSLQELRPWMVVVAAVFAMVATVIPGVALLLKGRGAGRLLRLAASVAALRPLLRPFADAPTMLLRRPGVVLGSLLLRGFTLWLPMLPGLWLMRRELR